MENGAQLLDNRSGGLKSGASGQMMEQEER